MQGELHLTFNADGWPAKKIAMFALLMGLPPMDTYQEPKWRWRWAAQQYAKLRAKIPLTAWRVRLFYAYHGFICSKLGHSYDTKADLDLHVCSRCVQFTKDADELP